MSLIRSDNICWGYVRPVASSAKYLLTLGELNKIDLGWILVRLGSNFRLRLDNIIR